MELSFKCDEGTLFQFKPITNLIAEDTTRKYITDDAYFRIFHVQTQSWILFNQKDIEKNEKTVEPKLEKNRNFMERKF